MVDTDKFKIDPKKASKDEIQEALALLEKKRIRKARIDAGEIKGGGGGKPWAEMSEEEKEKRRQYNRRRTAELQLFKQKAIEAGITVSEQEVDNYLSAE